MQVFEIVEYFEENGLYYQFYIDKGVYVLDYGVESVCNEIEYVKNLKENFDLKELKIIVVLYFEYIVFYSVESCKLIVEIDIYVYKLLLFFYDIEKLKKLKEIFFYNIDLVIIFLYWYNLEINY